MSEQRSVYFPSNLVFFCLVCVAFFATCSESGEQRSDETAGRQLDITSAVSFLNTNEEVVSSVDVAVAGDDQSRSEGLMDIHELPSDAGMLFIFDDEAPRSFWMANTPLSLDVIFVNSDFEIVRIHRNTTPFSHESVVSEQPAKYVVEVNAGYTLRHDIVEGMKIRVQEDDGEE